MCVYIQQSRRCRRRGSYGGGEEATKQVEKEQKYFVKFTRFPLHTKANMSLLRRFSREYLSFLASSLHLTFAEMLC